MTDSRQGLLIGPLCIIVALLILVLHANPAQPAVLEIVPTKNTDESTVNVLIRVAGLGELSPPSLASFDIELLYSPRVLTLNRINFLGFLGDPNFDLYTCFIPCALQGGPLFAIPRFPSGTQAITGAGQPIFPLDPATGFFVVPTSEALHLTETSLLGIALDGAQPSDFPLISIDFSARARGISELGVFINGFDDIVGDLIPISNATDVLSRSFVRGPSVKIPEPATVLLMVIALACLPLLRRITARKNPH